MGYIMAHVFTFGIPIIMVAIAALLFFKYNKIALPIALVVLAIPASITTYVMIYRSTAHHEVITVTEKQRTSGDDGQWVIFADNGKTYGVTDTIGFWNWRASDRYGALRVNATFDCNVAGWRFGPASEYENLVSCTPVDANTSTK